MINKAILILVLILSKANISWAQFVQKDTSYTVNRAYLKYKKDFPNIKIAEANDLDVSVQQNVIYHNTGTRDLMLDLYRPEKQTQNLPVIFMIHGGGWKSGDKYHMQVLGIVLASKGYVTVAIEYRLSAEAPYPAAVLDVEAAMQWTVEYAKELHIDTAGFILLGCSSGGQLATLVGVNPSFNSPKIKAIINLDGILAFHHTESEEGASAALWLGGSYETAKENWEVASPLKHAGKGDPPILFVNSQYPRFHAGRDEMITILSQANIYTKVHELPDTPHTFWLFDPWFLPTVGYILQFLDKVISD
ncbi:Acetyl esterase/lipase [Reichenbachiella faecimaris]|uniref:Acetyl esterase/lipase n=1 Tax=Reichenbachiella faecimaris TaxID=692418 RepID=A0A1W2G769_REIFA|nr:alpha/beta hydrolase [Reichenbachiella faecimaris]SMD32282.1 Acetyl esterase/lipase [Reichenbachiella faecimaris]